MKSLQLKQLKALDFDVKTSEAGLLFVNKHYKEIAFNEVLEIERARKIGASAVYFQRFGDNNNSTIQRKSIPQIYIFDNSNNEITKEKLVEIHKKLWSGEIIPIYYVLDKTQIRIYDGRVPIKIKGTKLEIEPLETLVADSVEAYQKYSAKLFENGIFWERSNHFKKDKTAQKHLIKELKRLRKNFIEETGIVESDKPFAHKLIVLCIFIKYLEERKDETGKKVFPKEYFEDYFKCKNFCDVIRKKKLIKLFEQLSEHFNGEIFKLKEAEKKKLTKIKNIARLADFLDADYDGDQKFFWRLYAFDYLPVELISRVYEEFMPQKSGVAYTPVHLANFMVDECMPINKPQKDFKAIDISCGSGIFLVTVFYRIVQWWQFEEYQKTGKLKRPQIDVVKKILKNSIYGIDTEAEAVRLAVFSLSIALCEMLNPTIVWEKLKFDNLEKENILNADFFNKLKENKGKFDLIIGNPPFEEKNQSEFSKILEKISAQNIKQEVKIPQNQIALLFLQQAMLLLKEKGLLSLIMPSGPLIYNETLEYRKEFLLKYTVPQIIDLTSFNAKGALFEKAISTAVIFANKLKPKGDETIFHITLKRTKAAKEKLFFEIDHYDFHSVPLEIAKTDAYVWKCNLVGGSMLYSLIKRFAGFRTLKKYLDEQKEKNNEWSWGEGYKVANKNKPDDKCFITGKPTIIPSSFTGEQTIKTAIERATKFETFGNINAYQAPHLMIKMNIGKKNIPISYSNDYLTFKDEVVGIHSPGKTNELKKIFKILKKYNNFFRIFLISISSRAGIRKSINVIKNKDIFSLPFPKNLKELSLSKKEKIIIDDILDYKIEEFSKHENAEVNKTDATLKETKSFSNLFCKGLNSVYATSDKQFYSYKAIFTETFICIPFGYGLPSNPHKINIESIKNGDWNSVIKNKVGKHVLYNRIIKIYGKDLIFFIKPKTLRYWLKSIALKDAAEVFNDLVKGGY